MSYADRMFQALAGFGAIAMTLAAGMIWVAGPAAALALLPAYFLLLAGAAVRVRFDARGLRVHGLGFLPVTGLKACEVEYAATGVAKLPFLGGVVLKSGGALSAGGVLEHAIIRSGPVLVVTGPYRLKVVVSAAGSEHAGRMAEVLNGHRTRDDD